MLSPLSERVDAPTRLPLPIHPDVAVWRPLTIDDAAALAALHALADPLDHPEWTVPEAELRERLVRADLDLARDSIAAVADDGTVVAYGINFLDQNPSTLLRVILDGTISPTFRARGLGRLLLTWQRGRAQQQLAASALALPGWILTWQPVQNEAGVALARLLGFRPVRYSMSLTRDLTEPVTPRPRPDEASFRIVPWNPELSAAALAAHRAAFRDHWGSQPLSDAAWAELTEGEFFRPDLTFLALDANAPTEVVGYTVTSVFEHDVEHQGYSSSYLDLLGTRREHRGHGIASALLTHVLDASKAAGLERVVLDVDTENPSGAVGLYTSLGFVPADFRQVALLLNY